MNFHSSRADSAVMCQEMEMGIVVQEDIVLRGVEFSVKIDLEERLLTVEISDTMTADQWRGEFDPAYIEDLTRKTGNFKQFPIFCSMFESAIKQTSESVTLDLLTYTDLELLRNRKAGVVGRPRSQQQCPALSTKRYLILIYTVEFDRIHYPLPLPYQGKPDPADLQKEIRALRTKLNTLGIHGGHKPAEPEIQRLRAELALVKQEKDTLAKTLERLQIVENCSTPGGGGRGLREAIRTLEEQLLRERAKNQRTASRKGHEQRLLIEQLDILRATETTLRIRVKTLTNELAMLQRGRVTPVSLSRRGRSRGDEEIQRSQSRDRNLGRVMIRARSGSRDNKIRRSEEEGQRYDSSGLRAHVPRSSSTQVPRLSASPTGSTAPRFDPTAYIHNKQRRQREAALKGQRKVRRDILASPVGSERGRSRSREAFPHLTHSSSMGRGRSLSVESKRSKQLSEDLMYGLDELSKPLTSRQRKETWNGPTMPRGKCLTRKPLSSTPTEKRRSDQESSNYTGANLSEIDARLQALQDYMKDLDTHH